MGYESKLYVVEKYDSIRDEKRFANVIAMFDMCKFYPLSDVLRSQPETDCYFYADDGDTQVLEDLYGKPLTEASVDKVVEILEAEISNGNDYRRIGPVLGFLRVVSKQQKNGVWKNVTVLHYGH